MPAICSFFFFFNDTATTEIYTLSLHDALPIFEALLALPWALPGTVFAIALAITFSVHAPLRSEEHTSELQSPCNLVCRLLLEKKKRVTSTKYCPNRHSRPTDFQTDNALSAPHI